jgi:hypothetical protein
MKDGVDIDEPIWSELIELAAELGVTAVPAARTI